MNINLKIAFDKNNDTFADNVIYDYSDVEITYYPNSFKFRKNVSTKKVIKTIIDSFLTETICSIFRIDNDYKTLCGKKEYINCPCVQMCNKLLYNFK